MQPIGVLTHFSEVKPRFLCEQAKLISWITQRHAQETQDEQLQHQIEVLGRRFVVPPNKIATRYLEAADLFLNNENRTELLSQCAYQEGQSTLDHKMKIYSQRSQDVFPLFYQADESPAAQLIHVSCTGYIAPSAAQRFVASQAHWLAASPGITHAYHMGCYAALPAIRMAESYLSLIKQQENHPFTSKRIDIVHNEMCSLHMDTQAHTPEQFVVQTLFADGHIRYSLEDIHNPQVRNGLALLRVEERLLPNTHDLMTWIPKASGFAMSLAREVPNSLTEHIRPFVLDLVAKSGMDLKELLDRGLFAIHPGGPKIIELLQEKLELRDDQIHHSRKVLFERGNMSSATVPHIWQAMLHDGLEPQQPVLSLAFGPGLTMFGACLRGYSR